MEENIFLGKTINLFYKNNNERENFSLNIKIKFF